MQPGAPGNAQLLDFVGSPSLFDRKNANRSGKYSELLVLSAFVANGTEVALPFGNQAGWDILARIDGVWNRIQVKTATPTSTGGGAVNLCRDSGSRATRTPSRFYSEKDADYIAAVIPENGAIWLLPITVVSNQGRVKLGGEHLWVRGADMVDAFAVRQMIELRRSPKPIPQTSSKLNYREVIRNAKERPEGVSDASWDLALRYAGGETYAALAVSLGISPYSVSERVQRVGNRVIGGGRPSAKRDAALFDYRAELLAIGNCDRPTWVNSKTWELSMAYRDGVSYKDLCAKYSLSRRGATERIRSVIIRLRHEQNSQAA